MVVIRTEIKELPEYCEQCHYYGVHQNPYDRWLEKCELCRELLNNTGGGWKYDGSKRPDNCPLMEVSNDE